MAKSRPLIFQFILGVVILCVIVGCYAPKMLVLWIPILLLFVLFGGLAWALKHKKGVIGEKVVAHILRKDLPEEEYIILNDVYLPLPDATTTQIDHIIVSRYGIFALETKAYSGWIYADSEAPRWTQVVYRKKSSFQNPIRQNYRHISAIAENLGIDKVYVKGLVVFTGGSEFKTPMPEGVVYPRTAAPYIRTFTTPIIKDAQVPEIAQAISEWSATLSKEQVANHVINLQKTHGQSTPGEHPLCPFCHSPMVRRNNRTTHQSFWGCPNYPKCRGTRPC